MNTPKIQFGSNIRKEVIDEQTVKTTTTKFHRGKGVATNRLSIRDRIPSDKYTIDELTKRFQKLVADPYKIDPSFSVVVGSEGNSYDIIVEYTLLEV